MMTKASGKRRRGKVHLSDTSQWSNDTGRSVVRTWMPATAVSIRDGWLFISAREGGEEEGCRSWVGPGRGRRENRENCQNAVRARRTLPRITWGYERRFAENP